MFVSLHEPLTKNQILTVAFRYRNVASTSLSHFEAHVGLFRLLMKGICDAYVLGPFGKKVMSELE